MKPGQGRWRRHRCRLVYFVGNRPTERSIQLYQQNKGGAFSRSSSKYFLHDKGNVTGSLCINHDITDLVAAQGAITKNCAENVGEESESKEEVFTSNIDELLRF